jgi:hypothetical protein
VLAAGGDEGALDGAIDHVVTLVDDVAESYRTGESALAARLAASLFIRSYDPIREQLAARAPDIEAEVTQILAFDLRRAINDGAQPDDIEKLSAQVTEGLRGAKGETDDEVSSL